MSVQVQSPYGRGSVLQKNFFLTLLTCAGSHNVLFQAGITEYHRWVPFKHLFLTALESGKSKVKA